MKKSIASASAAALGIVLANCAMAQNSVYSGKPVELTEAENGAVMNAGLAADPFMQSHPMMTQLNERVWTVHGYSLANCTFVITDAGVVVFDTGNNIGQGKYFLSRVRSVTDKPIIAIIYSHTHYIGGAEAFLEGASGDVEIYAHPELAAISPSEVALAQGRWRRSNMQFGAYLPKEGPDARATTPEPDFEAEADRAFGGLPVTHAVQDGETIEIGGLNFQFMWTPADTLNSLSVWIPELETVLTNTVSNMYYPLYTLRGETYRDPNDIIGSYDRLRALPIRHYAPVHGRPISGEDKVYETLTRQRDAYSFTYNQTVRGINAGKTPDELVASIQLPPHLAEAEGLNEVYSEVSFAVRGIYRGLMGWFDEDTTELHPPADAALGQAIVEGFGGIDAVLAAAADAQEARRYNLAAKLAKYAVDAGPDSEAAKASLARSLRSLAQVSISLQAHNFYMTEAHDLEGRTDRFAPPEDPVFAFSAKLPLMRMSSLELARLLESRINPEKSADIQRVYSLSFSDAGDEVFVHIRRGVAEVTEDHDGNVDAEIEITRQELIAALTGGVQSDACTSAPETCAFFEIFR